MAIKLASCEYLNAICSGNLTNPLSCHSRTLVKSPVNSPQYEIMVKGYWFFVRYISPHLSNNFLGIF